MTKPPSQRHTDPRSDKVKLAEDGLSIRNKRGLFFALMVLAGCGGAPLTQEQICRRDNFGQLNAIQRQIYEIQTSLDRGYRLVSSTQPTTRMGTCSTNNPGYAPIYYRCQRNSSMTVETPVSIDHAEERRKLAYYKRQYSMMPSSAEAGYKRCMAQ